MGKRGFERIESLWDEKEPVDPKQESFAAATLDRHDDMVRRNLGMNETQSGTGAQLNLNVSPGGRAIVQIAPELPEQAPMLPVGESISPERRATE